jgi:hypothetical protein
LQLWDSSLPVTGHLLLTQLLQHGESHQWHKEERQVSYLSAYSIPADAWDSCSSCIDEQHAPVFYQLALPAVGVIAGPPMRLMYAFSLLAACNNTQSLQGHHHRP